MTGWFAAGWYAAGAFVQIDDVLRKRDNFDPADYFYYPDTASPNFQNSRHDPSAGLQGPMFGLNFQGNILTLAINLAMADEKGIPVPTAGKFGVFAEFQDALKMATDPDTDTFGMQPRGYWFSIAASTGFSHSSDPGLMWYDADALKTTFLDSGADIGFRTAADWILKDKVVHPGEMNKQLSGEFGDTFSAGKTLFRQAGGPMGTQVGRIKDRFTFALVPLPEGPDGEPVLQQFSDQPHLVTDTAVTRGTLEGAVEWVAFLSGPAVQERIAIDRGSSGRMPLRRTQWRPVRRRTTSSSGST
jgi:ABC-type glycerol-3-phosphate transport system substrate-binding protein